MVSEYQFLRVLDKLAQEDAAVIRQYVTQLEREIEGLNMSIESAPEPRWTDRKWRYNDE